MFPCLILNLLMDICPISFFSYGSSTAADQLHLILPVNTPILSEKARNSYNLFKSLTLP